MMSQNAITINNRQLSPFRSSTLSTDSVIIDGNFYEVDPGSSPPSPSLIKTIQEFRPFPEKTVILGVCDDHLPLVIDLKNPRSGSILITGEPGCGKTNLLETIAESACLIDVPDSISFCIISSTPDEFAHLYNHRHCQALVAPYERVAGEIILELSAIAEQRRSGRERGPAFLLIIDDIFPLLTQYFDFNTFTHLKWLILNGPRSQVWPMITVQNNWLQEIKTEFLNSFPFHICGLANLLLPYGENHSDNLYTKTSSINYFQANLNRTSIRFRAFNN